MSRRVWKIVEAVVEKTKVAKIERRRDKKGRGKEIRREGAEKTSSFGTLSVKILLSFEICSRNKNEKSK